jgi:DNA-binding PucR family transcriptional regulator
VFVDRLLGQRWHAEAEIRSHAAAVGCVVGSSSGLLVVVSGADNHGGSVSNATGPLLQSLDNAVAGAVRWSPVPHVPVFVADAHEDTWLPAGIGRTCEEHGVFVVVVGPTPSLVELAESFRGAEARLAEVYGARRSPGVVEARELEVLHLLVGTASPRERLAFVRRVLGRLLLDKRADDLLAVLEAVYRTTGTAAAVGQRLHMDKSTVHRRFRAIAQLTGCRPAVVGEQYELLTAFLLHTRLSHDLEAVGLATV